MLYLFFRFFLINICFFGSVLTSNTKVTKILLPGAAHHGRFEVPTIESLAGATGLSGAHHYFARNPKAELFVLKPEIWLTKSSGAKAIWKYRENFLRDQHESCWPEYFKYYSSFMTLNRLVMVDLAIDLFNQLMSRLVFKKKDENILELVALSHGGSIALLFIEVLCVASFGKKVSASLLLKANIDPEVVKRRHKILHKNPFKTVRLTTIGTPVSYENNKIMNNLIYQKNITFQHLHLFSKSDKMASVDPGLCSEYWHGMPRRGLGIKFSGVEPGRFRQSSILFKKKDGVIFEPGHGELIYGLTDELISKIWSNSLIQSNSFFKTILKQGPFDNQILVKDDFGKVLSTRFTFSSIEVILKLDKKPVVFNSYFLLSKKLLARSIMISLLIKYLIKSRPMIQCFLKK
jgi:hypothetical protein